ncbi:EhbH [Methanothermobacter tenebrarum]|uniref:EhbH n=1 Tax=Methanothermobacter tenebrarum TaxID=680118 RepID=A0A328PIC5_9EURY|nr:EhbH [Methanothermobacter tenebrarum]MBC7101445.1 EhbH [Methanobacteriales archaeon]MBC7118405.1 EhbH [Methanobacteriaceae archaeon]NPV65256.1 EhbH [Methanobacteriaceae archaeon]RAO79615.1 EhbH [Methanothermobacter tenebrarum]
MSEGIRSLIVTFSLVIFGVTLFDTIIGLYKVLNPGISWIYNYVGTRIAPNMVTIVVFDWRGYDTLGEALILVTAVIVTLLIFGRGKVELGGK